MRRSLLIALFAVLMVMTMTGAAFAGEVAGTGKGLKNPDGSLDGRSICAFSGLNNTYSGDPNVPDENGFFRTRSWGQIPEEVRDFLASIGLHPGSACNPERGSA